MTVPYDSDGLWMKARLFVNRSMDDGREFEEGAFWASAALELLGKAALSRINPLLIALPSDDGKSLLIAAGTTADASGFMSVPAKAVWARCAAVFKPFNEAEAKLISAGRNDYLHAADVGFGAIPDSAWWPRYWAQATVLLSHLDKSVEDLVGPSRLAVVERHLETNAQHMRARLSALLERARTRKIQHDKGAMSAAMASEWTRFAGPSLRYRSESTCPACSEVGWREGEDFENTRIEYEDDGFGYPNVFVTLEVQPVVFWCPSCHLVLEDLSLLSEAGMESTFETEGDVDDLGYDSEYNNE